MTKIEKPWGYEIHWTKNDNYVGKLLFINAGQRLSKQYHEIKEKTLYVLSGILYNYDERGVPNKIFPGESIHIKAGEIHRFSADSCSVEVIEVSNPHLDDVVRLEDDYFRE